MQVHQLDKKIIIKGKIIAITGLMIGSNNAAMDIGGTDKQVIRNPINSIPYIPGSSLKGKMRSQFEISRGQVGEKGGPSQNHCQRWRNDEYRCFFKYRIAVYRSKGRKYN